MADTATEPEPAPVLEDLKDGEAKAGKVDGKFSLEIVMTVRTAQLQNGMRQYNYQRYHKHCSSRLRRLHKMCQLHQSKGKTLTRKTIEPATVQSNKFLLVPLVQAERAWATAMELKELAASSDLPRAKFHVVARLRKAAKWADKLAHLCEATADSRTILEAQAYAHTHSAQLELEREQWAQALAAFTTATTIYRQLAQHIRDPEYKDVCSARLEDFDASVRYCKYNLARSGDGSADPHALIDLKMAKGSGTDLLAAKMEDLLAEARKEQAQSLSEVSWKGRSLAIKNEKVRVAILAGNDFSYEIDKTEGAKDKVALYDKLFVSFNDGLRELKEELHAVERGKQAGTDEQLANLRAVTDYLTTQKLRHTIDRNRLLIKSMQDKPAVWGIASSKKQASQADDLVRLYENVLQNVADMVEVDPQGQVCGRSPAPFQANLKAHRCYFMALSFGAASKWAECAALLSRAEEYAKGCLSNADTSTASEAKELISRIDGQLMVAAARANLESVVNEDGGDAKDDVMAGLSTGELAEVPPPYLPTACKPQLFDLALLDVEFPALDARMKAATGSKLSSFFSWWKS